MTETPEPGANASVGPVISGPSFTDVSRKLLAAGGGTFTQCIMNTLRNEPAASAMPLTD